MELDSATTKTKLAGFLARGAGDYQLKEDDDIFELGFVSSLFAMELVAFIEKEFGIVLKDDDLDFNNFRTLASLMAFIGQKKLALKA